MARLVTCPSPLETLADLLRGRRVVVLTGAGVSTESGIPDYRGPQARLKPRNPIRYQSFVKDPFARVRYWARSTLGWPRFRAFAPNRTHEVLCRWERDGVIHGLITQNVDRLHSKAGHEQVIELHGSLYEASCLTCRTAESRDSLQERLLALNEEVSRWPYQLAPDGDADIPEEALRRFTVPECLYCGGVMKPDVVFFGENVPPERVQAAYSWVDNAEVLLVIGSSLAIWSGYRFVLRASGRQTPIAVMNLGETRADALASVKVEGSASALLLELEGLLRSERRGHLA